MAEKMRSGILATGWIADLFVQDLLRTGHSVTAVGSRTEESAKRFAKQFGIATAHGSYAGLAADPNVDVIAAPSSPFGSPPPPFFINVQNSV